MALPPDRVQVIKQESAALGGNPADELPFDAPIEPQEDAIEAAGVYLQNAGNRDETTVIWRDTDDDMNFKDGNNPSGATLTQLLSGALPPATEVGQVIISMDGANFTIEQPVTACGYWITDELGRLIVKG